jgi:hypothetical protein
MRARPRRGAARVFAERGRAQEPPTPAPPVHTHEELEYALPTPPRGEYALILLACMSSVAFLLSNISIQLGLSPPEPPPNVRAKWRPSYER